MNSILVRDWMNFLIFSTTLSGNYDNWKNNSNISEIINVKTNPMCVNIKNNYPDIENKVIQSIVLGFFCNVCYTISQHQTHDKLIKNCDEFDDIPDLMNLEID